MRRWQPALPSRKFFVMALIICAAIPAGCIFLIGPSAPPIAPQMAPPTHSAAAAPILDVSAILPSPTPSATIALSLPTATATPLPLAAGVITQVIGLSRNGYPLEEYRFGQGAIHVTLVGGIHGGYEWNTILLARQMIDYLALHPELIPISLTVHIIPSANPDGQVLATGTPGRFTPSQVALETRPGRLNGAGVDLNRNWECHWSPTGLWGTTEVSGGSAPFSEPETQALKRFLSGPPMHAVVFWHSAVPGVFAGGCDAPFEASVRLTEVYAQAAGYPFHTQFTSYVVTGDVTDWLSTQGIPGITVELNNHSDLDWEQNLAGTLALFAHLGNQP